MAKRVSKRRRLVKKASINRVLELEHGFARSKRRRLLTEAFINRILQLEHGFAKAKRRRLVIKAFINRFLGRKLVKKVFINRVQEQSFARNCNLKMVAAPFYIAKQNDEKPLGEDAYFVCDEGKTIGVADGVGGWAKKGIDAGIYARELMKNAFYSVQEQAMKKGSVDPKQALHEAFLNTKVKGSSTACIITLKGDVLLAMNVGDSGFMVIREGQVVYQSPSQQRSFNHPYQLGNESDNPDLALELVVKVKHGDILVAGTDGLFDNLFPADIEGICRQQMESLPALSRTIAEFARKQSINKDCISPFAETAKRLNREHLGGKYDDITVIVAYIE